MGVQFKTKTKGLKPQVKAKSAVKSTMEDTVAKLETMVDQLGDMKAELENKQDEIAPLAKKTSETEKELLTLVDTIVTPSQTINIVGEKHELTLGKKGVSTSITDVDKAVDLLEETKEGLALELASFKLGDLKAYLTPDEFKSVTSAVRKNARSKKWAIPYQK